ncbi:MAG: tetratricopeptide repeat protein [Bacteroidota bacterium]
MRSVLVLLLVTTTLYGQTVEKAKTLFEASKPEEAKKLLASIDEDHADYAAAQYYLGRIAFNQNKVEDAEAHFEEATEANDKVADYHYWYASAMGRLAQQSNTFKQGVLAPRIKSEFEKTVQLDPNNLDAHWGLIEFYTQAPGFMGGSWEKAEQTAKNIQKINKAEGHRAMAVVYQREEKLTEAEGEFIQAYKTDPKMAPTLANFYLTTKKFDKAFTLFDDMLKKNPDDMLATYQIGKTSAISGQKLELGESCLVRYLRYQPKENEPSHAGANMRLAQIKEKKGNKPDAKKHFETALKLDPNLKEAKEGLARLK